MSSTAELKELEKYIKFFSTKSMQVIAHSRASCSLRTKCNPASVGLHWFNIAITEDELSTKIASEMRSLHKKSGAQKSVSIDIVLRTSENLHLLLERWVLYTTPSIQDTAIRSNFTVYNRFSILLRSVITISRILPAFGLSRRLDQESQLYVKFNSNMQLNDPSFETFVIGSVATSVGTTVAQVFYRRSSFLGNEDSYPYHDASGVISLAGYGANATLKQAELSAQLIESEIALALSDDMGSSALELPSIVKLTPLKSPGTSGDLPLNNVRGTQAVSTSSICARKDSRLAAAFVDNFNSEPMNLPEMALPSLSSTPPFVSLLHNASTRGSFEEGCFSSPPLTPKENTSNERRPIDEIPQTAQAVGFEDDFVLVELRPAFFTEDDSVGRLYRKCQSPPMLDMFSMLEQEDKDAEVFDLDVQLEMYKKDLLQFDRFLESL